MVFYVDGCFIKGLKAGKQAARLCQVLYGLPHEVFQVKKGQGKNKKGSIHSIEHSPVSG